MMRKIIFPVFLIMFSVFPFICAQAEDIFTCEVSVSFHGSSANAQSSGHSMKTAFTTAVIVACQTLCSMNDEDKCLQRCSTAHHPGTCIDMKGKTSEITTPFVKHSHSIVVKNFPDKLLLSGRAEHKPLLLTNWPKRQSLLIDSGKRQKLLQIDVKNKKSSSLLAPNDHQSIKSRPYKIGLTNTNSNSENDEQSTKKAKSNNLLNLSSPKQNKKQNNKNGLL